MNIHILKNLAVSEIEYKGVPKVDAGDAQLALIVNFIFGLAGAIALLFVVIGGLRYIISQGDPNAAAQAKNTILYALVGLVVTVTAYAIVRFAVGIL